ncbi:Sulfatase [Pelotomaculum schinkii]|uniref:Sulfatase n=1 Tax=Pelotomaculum schinkii TaxID=78350 RepID=A0A4Y7R6N7_9FIRM|nr:sulfatase-like hydrolase/transferase [Pelotomaculum schinkii]TEB04614.1 Sulfatase [Pelotomaculum schinkii]
MLKKVCFIHPFLFSIFPALFLYSHNIKEASINQIFLPIIFSFTFTFFLFIILYLGIKDITKASLITSVFVVMFFTYGHLFDLLKTGDIFIQHRYLLPSTLLLWGYITYFIIIVKKHIFLENLSNILVLISLSLVAVNIFTIVPYEFKKSMFVTLDTDTGKVDNSSTTLPDVYYVILDEYASLNTIKNYYMYDNSQFAEYLVDNGFYVAEESRSKYTQTYKSIDSSLNMKYLDNEGDLITYQEISNNKVFEYFKKKGYKNIYIGNWYDLTRYKINADYQYNYYIDSNSNYLDEFSVILINSTILKPFNYLFNNSYDSSNMRRNAITFAFNKLKYLPETNSPKFVFAHILCPHTPFVFDQNGGEVNEINSNNWVDKQYYLNQYIYTTKQVEILVNELLTKSVKPPIIIIQSDHGPRPNDSLQEQGVDITKGIPEGEMHRIFNAYYCPGIDKKIFYSTISPVNSFRLILKYYFGEDIGLLEDYHNEGIK